ncbi:esterase/lipase family protein [Streptomyces gobiensis]|uniref:esterase/lipase family protein n=1 Tax=Streptomyces gobiensis TaxID=2875706 RepID=UPI001E4BC1FB|nr:alpha/beta fold hydrolase [Streptomyces gobiensis]UGY93200.1 alpha/beta fold hydrolase [Streptomyces gobiensis]
MNQLSSFLSALRSTTLEATVLVGHLLLYPTGLRQERPLTGPESPTDICGPRPVLLIHGFVDNRSVFTLLRRSLARHGWQQLIGLNYSPLTCDIRAAAEQLGQRIEEICERTGHSQVDIVGHSLGGLIARYYAQRLNDGTGTGTGTRVHTLITLGTPHSGTRVVPPMSAHPIVRQMRPDSDVVRELAGPAPGCRTRFVSFWSDLDELMSPAETARLDHPDLLTRSVRVHGVGHLAMPVHWAVTARIRQELTESGLTRPAGETSAGAA